MPETNGAEGASSVLAVEGFRPISASTYLRIPSGTPNYVEEARLPTHALACLLHRTRRRLLQAAQNTQLLMALFEIVREQVWA
jgi:hypothetical protein